MFCDRYWAERIFERSFSPQMMRTGHRIPRTLPLKSSFFMELPKTNVLSLSKAMVSKTDLGRKRKIRFWIPNAALGIL